MAFIHLPVTANPSGTTHSHLSSTSIAAHCTRTIRTCAFTPTSKCVIPPAAVTAPRLVPAHMSVEPMILTEENIEVALDEVKVKLGSMFGNSAENLKVGITGDVKLASLDGPMVVLRLEGRFWHQRSDVLARVAAYLMERIPEICDVDVEDVQQLEDSEEEAARQS